MGAAKHPQALGKPFLHVWSEIADDLAPIVDQAYARSSRAYGRQDESALRAARISKYYDAARRENGETDGQPVMVLHQPGAPAPTTAR